MTPVRAPARATAGATVRVVVVDDEAPARRKLVRMLAAEGGVEVVAQAGDGAAALAAVTSVRPELVFLDVQMPGMSGLEVAERLAADGSSAHVVFATAHDEFALRAFELHACGYLLKPYDRRRLADVLAHALAQIRQRQGMPPELLQALAELRAQARYPLRLLVEVGERAVLVEVAQLDRVQAARNYVELHVGGKTLLARNTLEAVEAQLDPEAFVRLSRSELVRIGAIEELRRHGHGEYRVRLRGGAELTWTRRYKERGPLVPALGRLVPKL
ncbi:MAG TPA: LytTR family DNA-binding domain-containing protein [Terriglobales bacterium]|nr:LytTR family DNA-binding domain-containing protein [Terriglobales bacterium]